MTISVHEPNERHISLMDELKAAIGRHTDLSGMEMLAVVAQLVGNIATYQDASRYTDEMVSELVNRNILAGNKAGLAQAQTSAWFANGKNKR